MDILFVASEMPEWDIFAGSPVETTTALGRDATYARASTDLTSSNRVKSKLFGAKTDIWIHGSLLISGGSAATIHEYYNNSGTAVFRLRQTSNGTCQMEYWNGSAWTAIGASFALGSAALADFDMHIVCGASGSAEFIINGSSVASGSASMTAVTNIDYVVTSAASTHRLSQYFAADSNTVNHKVRLDPPTSDGGDVDGTGTYAAVDEAVYSDADYIELTSAGNRNSFKAASRSSVVGANYVKGLTVSGRLMRIDASGPQQARPYLKISGTRYYGTTFALTTSWAQYQYTWEQNPATGADWVASAAADANLEWGWEAVA